MKKLTINFAIGLLLLAFATFISAKTRPETLVTLEGQVVCSVCWDEADRATTAYGNDADIQCAIRCAKRNIPQALAVMSEKGVTLYILEPGKVKGKEWFDLIGKFVKVNGSMREAGDKKIVKVEAIEKVSPEKK